MKSLLIERVANGYIVRPFTDSCGWPRGDECQMFVYRTVEEIQKDLPELLGISVDNPATDKDAA